LRLFVAALALPGVARAFEVGQAGRVDVTSTTQAGWHTDNGDGDGCNDDYGDLFERLNLVGSHGPFSLALRLDGSLFYSTPTPTAGPPACLAADLRDRYGRRILPEKISAGYNDGTTEVTLGDSYVQFGRGLALSLRKVDELGVDTTLQGGKAILRLGRVETTLVAGGTNIQNIDEATGRHADDPQDFVGGAHADVDVGRSVRLGAHGVVFAFADPVVADGSGGYQDRWIHWGPTFDAPRLFRNVGVYLELLEQRSTVAKTPVPPDTERTARQTAHAGYGTVTVSAGPATIIVEGKAYGSLQVVQPLWDVDHKKEFGPVQYTTPPTAERVLQQVNAQRDIWGGRTEMDWSFATWLSAFVNYGLFRDTSQVDTGGEAHIVHDPYAGVDVRWNDARSRVAANGGRRVGLVSDAVRTDTHADVDATQYVNRWLTVEARVQDLEVLEDQPGGDLSWREGTLQAGVKLRSTVGAAAIVDYTTNPTAGGKEWYPGGELDWTLGSSMIRLFAGGQRGGLKCVSGVCRVFPPFQGVKLIATLRF
jgi:uncharacterized protein DUF6029